MAPFLVPVGVAASTPHQAKVAAALSLDVCRYAVMWRELVPTCWRVDMLTIFCTCLIVVELYEATVSHGKI